MKNHHDFTAIQAARRLNIGLDYLYSLLWTGKLSGRKINGRWAISAGAVEERAKTLGGEGEGHGTVGH